VIIIVAPLSQTVRVNKSDVVFVILSNQQQKKRRRTQPVLVPHVGQLQKACQAFRKGG